MTIEELQQENVNLTDKVESLEKQLEYTQSELKERIKDIEYAIDHIKELI